LNPISSLLERWRRGRARIGEGEEAREAGALDERGPGLGAVDGDSIRVKAPSTETADELVDVLRKHGVAGDLRRPHGSEVEVVSPDDVPIGETMRATVRGVELWLLLPGTPDSIEVNCGKETVLVNRQDLASDTGAGTPSRTA
jgi:hypothetical protein